MAGFLGRPARPRAPKPPRAALSPRAELITRLVLIGVVAIPFEVALAWACLTGSARADVASIIVVGVAVSAAAAVYSARRQYRRDVQPFHYGDYWYMNEDRPAGR
jgi:hypothetical protein